MVCFYIFLTLSDTNIMIKNYYKIQLIIMKYFEYKIIVSIRFKNT